MSWLISLLKLIIQLVIPVAVERLIAYLKDGQELADWKKSEWAKIEAAARTYRQEHLEAGDDIEKQKAAFDKLLNSSK